MSRSVTVVLSIAALACSVRAGFYDEGTDVISLTEENWSEVENDTSHLWLVEFYANWCGHCKQYAPAYTKVAKNLKGLGVKVGAVNADDAQSVVSANGVQGFPTIKLFMPQSKVNPYTGKVMKESIPFQGARTARATVEFVTQNMPNTVVQVKKDLEAFKASNASLPKALLLSAKTETSSMVKGLALELEGRLVLGEKQGCKAGGELEKQFGVTEFPALVVFTEEGDIKYEGETKFDPLQEFLAKYALEKSVIETEKEKPLYETITSENFKTLVDSSDDAWMLAFGEEAPEGWDKRVADVFGQAKAGLVTDKKVAETLGASMPSVCYLPYYSSKKSAKHLKCVESSDKLKKAMLDTLPDDRALPISTANMDQFLAQSVQTFPSHAAAILFSEKAGVPPLYRALSLHFEGQLGFGVASASDKAILEKFGVTETPSLMVLFPQQIPNQGEQQQQNVQFQGMKFTPQVHGKFNFGNIASFLGDFLKQFDDAIEGAKKAKDEAAERKKAAEEAKGPLPELSADNFEKLCVTKGGLCGVALLDGAPEAQQAREGHIAMLEKLRSRKSGGPVNFMWVDAGCHPSFSSTFEVGETDLPTMVVFSPTKMKYAKPIGAFDLETLGVFSSSVASGKFSTMDFSALPTLDQVDCSTVARGAEALPEETPLDGEDDILAEILAEEDKKKAEMEAAAKEAAAKAAANASPDEKREVLLAAEGLEICDMNDLMCEARNDKIKAKVDKKMALDEKLAKIAAKKKKAKKKAAKAAKK